MDLTFKWPPKIEELGQIVKEYIDAGEPLSIPDDRGVYGELEKKFAALHNRKYALLVSSGTMALYSAFFALDLQLEDEVIVTAFTYHATATPLLHLNVKVIFCDVEPDTGNIDVTKIEPLITNKTKAIVTNDQWGHPCDKDAVVAICKKYNLKYVEDCSHAHFATYKNQYVGTFGDVACWSLQGNKLLTGGEGGILLTDDQTIFERAVLLGHNLKRPAKSVENPLYKPLERTGYGLKLRMHPLAARIVLHQLDHYVFDWIESRHETLQYFEKRLQEETPFQPMTKRDYVTSMGAWYGFLPIIPLELNVNREHLTVWMKERDVDIDIPKSKVVPTYELFYNPQFQVGAAQMEQVCPNANAYYKKIYMFPTFTFREFDVVDAYIEVIKLYFRENPV